MEHLINATCPECRGPLTEVDNDGITEFQCLVGHRYSSVPLLEAHSDAEERALWAAVVALEEAENVVRATAPHVPPEIRDELRKQAEERRAKADEIRDVLRHLRPFQTG